MTQENYTIESALSEFSVIYDYPDTIPELIVTNRDTSIMLNWSNIKQVIGVVIGGYEYLGSTDKYIHLLDDAILTYDNGMTVPLEFTHLFKCKLPSGFIGEFINYDDSFKIGYNGTKYYYSKSYRNTAGILRTLPTDWFVVAIQSSKVMIYTDSYTEILI